MVLQLINFIEKINIKIGEIITKEKLIFKRPGTGISPDRINELIGKTALINIKEDTVLKEDMFK